MSSSQTMTRRNFLKWTGIALGGTVVTCGGLAYLGTISPDVEIIQESCTRSDNMQGKILVAYATKSGTTGEIAKVIGESLCAHGVAADVRLMKETKYLEGYNAVVLGSAIRMGQWLPEAVEFVKKYQVQLTQMPTAFFTVHLLNLDDSEASQKARAQYTAPVRAIVSPDVEVFFAGRLEYARLSLFEKLIARVMNAPEQDLRDWNKIRGWGSRLPAHWFGAMDSPHLRATAL
jgi:menaquinone-dependent protoporphyrinogen oxidase